MNKDTVDNFQIRKLLDREIPAALDFCLMVFKEYESPVYSPEGTEEFIRSINDKNYLEGIEYYGTFDNDHLIGIIGIRKDRKHICFFFVDGRYHRLGIGTRMFHHLLKIYPNEKITLNAAPFGLPFYERIGFRPTEKEQVVNGIRFTPMEYCLSQCPCRKEKCERHGNCDECRKYHTNSKKPVACERANTMLRLFRRKSK